jgi:hypothetical protein
MGFFPAMPTQSLEQGKGSVAPISQWIEISIELVNNYDCAKPAMASVESEPPTAIRLSYETIPILIR